VPWPPPPPELFTLKRRPACPMCGAPTDVRDRIDALLVHMKAHEPPPRDPFIVAAIQAAHDARVELFARGVVPHAGEPLARLFRAIDLMVGR